MVNRIDGTPKEQNHYMIWISLDDKALDYLQIIRDNRYLILGESKNFGVSFPLIGNKVQKLEHVIVEGELDSKTLEALEEAGHLAYKQVTKPKPLERLLKSISLP